MVQAQSPADRLDGIVAVVGTHPILLTDVEAMAMTMASRGAAPTLEMRRAALEEMITHSLIAERAKRDTTIVVREDEVTMTLEQRTQELIRQMGSEEAVERMYGKSLLQLREDHRAEVRRQLMAQALQRRIVQNIRITPAEVRQWFNQIPADSLPEIPELVRIAHIVRFPAVEQEAREAARQRIDAIRDSVLAGETIEEMARRHSADPGSRAAGGRYSSVNVNDLVTEFGAVAATITPGDISHVFETQFGFHFMRVNDRRGDLLDFNHVLISVDETRTDPTAALRTLEMVRDSVVSQGASFARLAREYSEDQASSAHGGNVIVPQTGDRDLRFEALGAQWRATIDTLEVGEISRPEAVTLLDGRPAYHIVLLQRRVPAHRMSLETDWVLAEDFALQNKRQEVFVEWVQGLRKEVYVGCLDELLCPPRDGTTAATH
jgi:peptidyl-prolyl cis-trans isomerase SurA